MPCSATSQLTNASSPVLPLTQPTTPAQWNYFVARLQDIINAVSGAANRQPVNVVPVAYAVYNGSSLPALTVTGATAALDATKAQFGKASLKLTATAATVTVSFTGDPIVIQPFARWIESVYITSSRTSISGTLAVVTPTASYPVDISGTLLPATWGRLYGDCSLVADSSTQATMTLTLTGCSAGDTFNLEGWQLEQAAGNTNLPSAFVNSAAPGSQDTLPDGSGFVRLSSSHASGNVAYNYRGVWSSAIAYVTGDEVVYSGSYWLCLTGNTNSAPAQGNGNWQVVGAYNNYQGAWSSTVTYYAGQESTYSGNYWVATATNTNSAPGTSNPNWVIAGPQNLDKVPDGTARFAVINGGGLNAVAAVDPNKRALIDATQAGHIGAWNLDSRVADGTNFQRVGSGYADTSGRIVNLWDGVAIRSAVNTWDGANRARTGLQSSGVLMPGLHPVDNLKDGVYFRTTLTGSGSNILTPDFATFLGSAPPVSSYAPYITATLDQTPANLYGVSQALVLTFTAAPSVYYLNSTGVFMTFPPGQKWIVQMGCRGSISGATVQLQLVDPDGSSILGQTVPLTVPNSPAGLISGVIDCTGFTQTQGFLRIAFGAQWGAMNYLVISFVGIEQQRGNNTIPSAFTAPAARTLDEQQDGPVHGRTLQTYLSSNRPVFDLNDTFHRNKTQDYLPAGATYGQTALADLYSSGGVSRVGLRVAGSGHQIGDQRQLPPIGSANLRSTWTGQSISYSATAGTPATATISVTAATLLMGGTSVAYNAMSVGVTGTNNTNVTFYLYLDDPTYAGGALTLVATTAGSNIYGANGRVYVGSVAVTFPTSGSGSGGGSGGGGACVALGAYGPQGRFDRETRCVDTPDGAVSVRKLKTSHQKCVRVEYDNGTVLTCSEDAPLMGAQRKVLAIDALGETLDTSEGPSRVCRVESAGILEVVSIDAGDVAYYAADNPDGPFALHHNKIIP